MGSLLGMTEVAEEKVYTKTVTESAEDILARGLQGENVDAMLASLSPYGRQIFDDMIAQFRQSDDPELLKQLAVADYVKPPPSMREFIEDPYYLGTLMVKSQDTEGMFPSWKAILMKDFNYDSAIHNVVITGSLGIGKCWCSGTYIIMMDGSLKKVEDILPGDQLLGDDSMPRTVSSTIKGHGKVYEIYPSKGEPFTVNGDHILCLKTSTSEQIVEVSVNNFLQWPRQRKHAARLYRTGVDWPEKQVPIDPYVLGLWLGDGHSCQTVLTSADPALAQAWIDYGRSIGLTENVCTSGKGAKASSYQLSARGPDGSILPGKNGLKNQLKSLGFMSGIEGREKFIPQTYLINSHKTRLQLLAGLLDTDGSKASGGKCSDERTSKKNNGTYEITLKQEHFADQVRFLAQSLGYFAQTKIKIVNSTAYWRTIISGAYDVPSLLSRKQSADKGQTISPLTGHIRRADCLKTKFAVIPRGENSYYGFTIDGNHRCLLKDFTVTHNTFIMVTILLYRMVIATLLRNPHNFFGLTKGTKIIFNLLSVTKAAVTETAFGDAMNFMSNCPYFLDECAYDTDQQYTNFRIPLKNGLMLTAGSKGQHLLGRNVIGVGLDEGNWRLEAEPDTKAYELYNEVRNRINNRFRRVADSRPPSPFWRPRPKTSPLSPRPSSRKSRRRTTRARSESIAILFTK